MCVIYWSVGRNERFKFILASNRDEDWDRPTEALHQWTDNGSGSSNSKGFLVGGRDLKAGGTWLALNQRGWLATVTNIRRRLKDDDKDTDAKAEDDAKRSRGEIVVRLLDQSEDGSNETLGDRVESLRKSAHEYSAFNLMAVDLKQSPTVFLYCSNQTLGYKCQVCPETGGLSNSVLSEAERWPKVSEGRLIFERIIDRHSDDRDVDSDCAARSLVKDLFEELLANRQIYPDALLPTNTGYPVEKERLLSSIFITPIKRRQGPRKQQTLEYGTVSSTIVLVDQENHVKIFEKSYRPPLNNDKWSVADERVSLGIVVKMFENDGSGNIQSTNITPLSSLQIIKAALGTLGWLLGVAIIWGGTNPLIKRGSTLALQNRKKSTALGDLWLLLSNWQYLVPLAINLGGSVLYYKTLGSAQLTLVVPLTNALTFMVTLLVGVLAMGEPVPDQYGLLGISLLIAGVGLCVV